MDVQSGFVGEMSIVRAEGIDVGMVEACGWSVRNCLSWFLDRRSAEVFSTPGMCDTVICISNMAVRNHRHRRRCMAIRGALSNCFYSAAVIALKLDVSF